MNVRKYTWHLYNLWNGWKFTIIILSMYCIWIKYVEKEVRRWFIMQSDCSYSVVSLNRIRVTFQLFIRSIAGLVHILLFHSVQMKSAWHLYFSDRILRKIQYVRPRKESICVLIYDDILIQWALITGATLLSNALGERALGVFLSLTASDITHVMAYKLYMLLS